MTNNMLLYLCTQRNGHWNIDDAPLLRQILAKAIELVITKNYIRNRHLDMVIVLRALNTIKVVYSAIS